MFDYMYFNGFYREADSRRGATLPSPFGLKSAAKVLLFFETAKRLEQKFYYFFFYSFLLFSFN